MVPNKDLSPLDPIWGATFRKGEPQIVAYIANSAVVHIGPAYSTGQKFSGLALLSDVLK
jgi:hypothetical protein